MAIKKRIVIVEGYRLLREGLKAILAADSDYEVIGEACNAIDAVSLIRQEKPDLVMLDLSMQKLEGLSVLKDIKQSFPEVKVMVLSIHEARDFVIEAFKAGADSYFVKAAGPAELRMAIRSTLQGNMYISPVVCKTVLDEYLREKGEAEPENAGQDLAHREREILKLLAEGRQIKEIARLLGISVRAVEKDRSRLMQKLDLQSAAQLVVYACERRSKI